jgi:hypothetical protein
MMRKIVLDTVLFAMVVTMLTSCYYKQQLSPDAWSLTEKQQDSISFYTTHHYTLNYNFVVKADSLTLIEAEPEELVDGMMIDSITVKRHDHLVVADIHTVSRDSVDSVWVKVARDQATIGWIHECDLLKGVEPDDPISQFIDIFSNVHLLIFLVIICVIVVAYLMHYLLKRNAMIVHFHDIDSFYPTLLCLIVASSATLYACIQMYVPETWRHFYYHPTLNPFGLPFVLGIFIVSVWSMVIVFLASLEDCYRQLSLSDTLLYMLGLVGICAVDYVIFSISTLYYIGYFFLVVYIIFALYRYFRFSRCNLKCGNCGAKLHQKGKCPRCGAINE